MLNSNSVAAVVGTSTIEQTTTTQLLNSQSSPSSSSSTVVSSSATLSSSSAAPSDSDYAKVGLSMWLNNAPDRAEQHFRAKLQSTPIFAGYAFTVSMVGVLGAVYGWLFFFYAVAWVFSLE